MGTAAEIPLLEACHDGAKRSSHPYGERPPNRDANGESLSIIDVFIDSHHQSRVFDHYHTNAAVKPENRRDLSFDS